MDKITSRIRHLCYGLHMDHVSPVSSLALVLYLTHDQFNFIQILIAKKVVEGIYKGVTTVELDNLAAETAATMTTQHPDYALLAARIAVSNLHKQTKKAFTDVMTDLYSWVNPKTNLHCPMIADETYAIIQKHASVSSRNI